MSMKISAALAFLFMWSMTEAAPAPARTMCTPAEVKILSSPGLLAQLGKDSKFFAIDCAVTSAGGAETLIVLYILQQPGGRNAYLAAVPAAHLTNTTRLAARTESLGGDSWPFPVNGQPRFLTLVPAGKSTGVYVNPQTGPSATRFSRWVFDAKAAAFSYDKSHTWMVEAGKGPDVTQTHNRSTAKLNGRSVAL
jgi:hypothetical protein